MKIKGIRWVLIIAVLGLAPCRRERESPTPAPPAQEAWQGGRGLEGLSAFAKLSDPTHRAHALFAEIGKVLQHPRCVNCHPRSERPQQGDDSRPHEPMVVRGYGGIGAPGMLCPTCHGMENYRTVPGNTKWLLAPARMAWVGQSLRDICLQLKDKKRNGGRDLDAIHEHLAQDSLVAYGWNAPAHLAQAPGSQVILAALFRAWIDAGAECPPS